MGARSRGRGSSGSWPPPAIKSRPSSAKVPISTPTRSVGSRVAMAAEVCRPVYGCSFGDERFLALIAEGGWDLLSHHAADVTNYKSPDFDAIAAAGE